MMTPRQSWERPSAESASHASESYLKKLGENKEISIAERRRYLEGIRNKCLDILLNLEQLRRPHQHVRKEDLALLDKMVHARAVPLDAVRAYEVDVFLRMPTIVSDEAVSLIAMLESLAAYEQTLEAEAQTPPEKRERLAQARAQHLNVLRAEWDLAN